MRIQVLTQYKTREDYLCQLQELVTRLEQELEYQRNNFDALVQERIEELLTDPLPAEIPPGEEIPPE